MIKNLLEDLRDCITSFGAGKIEPSFLTDLFRYLRSHTRYNFSYFLSFVTNPAGLIHWAASLAGIHLITNFLSVFKLLSSLFLSSEEDSFLVFVQKMVLLLLVVQHPWEDM